jgi:hypothetical protein
MHHTLIGRRRSARAGRQADYFTYCSIGSVPLSSTSLVSTNVGTAMFSSTCSPASAYLTISTACFPTR